MARNPRLGLKVRRLREAQGISQVEAATQLGISASYLNLIEHNQRPLTVNLLFKVGQIFDVDLRDWSEGDEARLATALREVLTDPLFAGIDLSDDELGEAAVSVPNMAQALRELYAAYRQTINDVHTLGDQLADQAAMAGASMEVRTVLTSIRSFAEILRDFETLNAEQRHQFLSILVDESDKLVSVFDTAAEAAEQSRLRATTGQRQPIEEITRYLERHDNHFPTLEAAVEDVLGDWSGPAFALPNFLTERLAADHGVNVAFGEPAGDDAEPDTIALDPSLPVPDAILSLAGELGMRLGAEAFRQLMDDADPPPNARLHLERTLRGYLARALIMPYARFYDAAVECGYDLDALAARFHAFPLDAARRLTTLRRPGMRGVPFHLLVVDVAGNVRERISGSGMPLPRFGSACPKWRLHMAFANPRELLVERLEMPDGSTFVCLARHTAAPRALAFSLGCAEGQAAHVAPMAAGLRADATPAGVNCRICPRDDCQERAFDSLVGSER